MYIYYIYIYIHVYIYIFIEINTCSYVITRISKWLHIYFYSTYVRVYIYIRAQTNLVEFEHSSKQPNLQMQFKKFEFCSKYAEMCINFLS